MLSVKPIVYGRSSSLDWLTAPRVAALLAALLTISFWTMCRRSIGTHAATWLDGPVLDIIESFRSHRVYQLDGLRTQPYTVLTHTPLSYVIGYAFYRIWPGFAILRLINITATLGCAALIFSWVRSRTQSLASPIFAACSFLILPPVFMWSQTTRSPDALCCLFSLAALVTLDSRTKYRDPLIALFFTAAVLSKQTALLALLPTLLTCDYLSRKSPREMARWLIPSAATLIAFATVAQRATHGGFWINVVSANMCEYSLRYFILIAVRHLLFFWIFVAAVVIRRFRRSEITTAHVWAMFAIAAGLATCAKVGSDTMYFFDASAAVSMLAGLALNKGYARSAAALVLALLPCVLISDATISQINSPRVADGYQRMVSDLRPFPAVLSDAASAVDFATGRPWYWGDPLVLNTLARQGKWDPSAIDGSIASRKYDAIVMWDCRVLTPTQYSLLNRNYALWRIYPAFTGFYYVFLPRLTVLVDDQHAVAADAASCGTSRIGRQGP